jgi:hypothetical protein
MEKEEVAALTEEMAAIVRWRRGRRAEQSVGLRKRWRAGETIEETARGRTGRLVADHAATDLG